MSLAHVEVERNIRIAVEEINKIFYKADNELLSAFIPLLKLEQRTYIKN